MSGQPSFRPIATFVTACHHSKENELTKTMLIVVGKRLAILTGYSDVMNST
jgi:hemerythrin-like domain-containing protein